MRLWSIHPMYLDRQGLLAVWREGLLAKKVLQGATKGYKNHPQLDRFKNAHNPLAAIDLYLVYIASEALKRGYNFDLSKAKRTNHPKISVTDEQIAFERQHLYNKLKARDTDRLKKLEKIPKVHPLFVVVSGSVEEWEKLQL